MSTSEVIGNVKIRAALVLVSVFIIGMAAGAALWHVVTAPPGMPPMRGPLPFHRLGLSDEQHEKVNVILEAHRPNLDAVLDATYPKIRAINEKIEAEIVPILTQEQRKRLEEIKARRKNRPPRHGRRPGPHKPMMDSHLPPPPGPPPVPPPVPGDDVPPRP